MLHYVYPVWLVTPVSAMIVAVLAMMASNFHISDASVGCGDCHAHNTITECADCYIARVNTYHVLKHLSPD